MKRNIFILLMTVILMACNNKEKKSTEDNPKMEKKTENPVVSNDLFEKKWKLLELEGTAIKLDTTFPKTPHIIFDKQSKVSGNLGCNGFGAKVTLEGENEIKIWDIFSTQMACGNLEIEQQFSDVLRNTKSYQINGNTLILNNEKEEIIARFKNTPDL